MPFPAFSYLSSSAFHFPFCLRFFLYLPSIYIHFHFFSFHLISHLSLIVSTTFPMPCPSSPCLSSSFFQFFFSLNSSSISLNLYSLPFFLFPFHFPFVCYLIHYLHMPFPSSPCLSSSFLSIPLFP